MTSKEEDRRLDSLLKRFSYDDLNEPDFSMHTLSEQLHATNMVRFGHEARVRLLGGAIGVLVQLCCGWQWKDVGMQQICQCSEC